MSATRINVIWDGAVYKVDKPNWNGGMVVSASEYARLERERDYAVSCLKDVQEYEYTFPSWLALKIEQAIKDAEAGQ